MPSYVTPKKNTEFIFKIGLVDSANRPDFLIDPGIQAGDFQVSVDGGVLTNLATLPSVEPAGSSVVKVTLSAAEMNGDNITVQVKDQASLWDDLLINIQTTVNQIDDLSTFDESVQGVIVTTNNDKVGYSLTAGEHTNIATAVWSATTRTLTSFGTLLADIWNYSTRTLTEPGNPFAVSVGAEVFEIPASGFKSFRVFLFTYDATGVSANADALPTVTVENEAGIDRSANFNGGVVNDGPGVYYQLYQVDPSHLVEQLTFQFSMVIGGKSITCAHIALADNLDSLLNSIVNDPIPEITGPTDIPITPTTRQAIMLLYMDRRNNNLASVTQRQVMNDAGNAVLTGPMSDDGTTFRQGKLG